MKTRILSDAVLFALVLAAPWWLWALALAAGAVYFPFFAEGIILATLADVLYGAHAHFLLSFPFGLSALVLVLVMFPLRERFR